MRLLYHLAVIEISIHLEVGVLLPSGVFFGLPILSFSSTIGDIALESRGMPVRTPDITNRLASSMTGDIVI